MYLSIAPRSFILNTITYLFYRIQLLYVSIEDGVRELYGASCIRMEYSSLIKKMEEHSSLIKKLRELNDMIVQRLCVVEKIVNSDTLKCLEKQIKKKYNKLNKLNKLHLNKLQKLEAQHIEEMRIFKKEMSQKILKLSFSTDVVGWKATNTTIKEAVGFLNGNDWVLTDKIKRKIAKLGNGEYSENTLYNIEDWDTSGVTNMSGLFMGAKEFNQDISGWKVTMVENMSNMFSGTVKFNQGIGGWDTSKVTDMSNMFYAAEEFDQDISDWNVTMVENMVGMFSGTEKFNQDIGRWNVENVKYMHGMFQGAKEFDQDISDWNVTMVENMVGMFAQTEKFNMPLTWDDKLGNVLDMNGMFQDAKLFNQDISNWNMKSVMNTSFMFSRTEKFNRPLKWGNKIKNVKYMPGMFQGAKEFDQDISDWNVTMVENMVGMFAQTEKFNQDIGRWNVENVKNMNYMFQGAKLFNQNISGWNVTKVENMSNMFQQTEKFNMPLTWDDKLGNVLDMNGMFQDAKLFNQDISNWNMKSVMNTSFMFSRTEKFNMPLKWDDKLRNVKNMNGMFYAAKEFNQDISDWNVTMVENMSSMFRQTEKFNKPLNWTGELKANMNYMFQRAKEFNQDLSNWNVTNVTNYVNIFKDAVSMVDQHKPKRFR